MANGKFLAKNSAPRLRYPGRPGEGGREGSLGAWEVVGLVVDRRRRERGWWCSVGEGGGLWWVGRDGNGKYGNGGGW